MYTKDGHHPTQRPLEYVPNIDVMVALGNNPASIDQAIKRSRKFENP